MMFDTFDRNGNAEFPFPKSVVYRAVCEAVRSIRGMTVERQDDLTSRIEIKTGMSAMSWGEKITISVSNAGQTASVVAIGSGAKTVFGSATAHGKNKKNVSDILSATSEVLQREGQKWMTEWRESPEGAQTVPAPTGGPATRSVADELIKLAELRDKGILTEEEFAAQKVKILSAP